MKFGGSSIADGDRIRNVIKIVSDFVKKGDQVILVVSALQGITDELLKAANDAKMGNHVRDFILRIEEKHIRTAEEAITNSRIKSQVLSLLRKKIKELKNVLAGVAYLGELTPKSMDYILSFGETLSAIIVSGSLRDIELESKCFSGKDAGIVTDSNFGEAKPLMNLTKHHVKEKIDPLLDRKIIPVVTGYIAATQDGVITTFGRGGSDYSATVLGAAIEADEVVIWSDVDGMMTADPRIVRSARMIQKLSFQEAIEMAVFGAKGLHPRALEPAMEEGIPVRIRNTFNPLNQGTLIVGKQGVKTEGIVKAVSLIRDVSLVTITGAGMVGIPGTAARVFDVLRKNNINVLMISQSASETDISIVIRRRFLMKAVNSMEMALLGQGIVREIETDEKVNVVAIIGAGMKGTPGVAARVFNAVSCKEINLLMISQGSSEVNISFAVKEEDGEKAVRAIHEEFDLDKTN